jgi:hypothetical protein
MFYQMNQDLAPRNSEPHPDYDDLPEKAAEPVEVKEAK